MIVMADINEKVERLADAAAPAEIPGGTDVISVDFLRTALISVQRAHTK